MIDIRDIKDKSIIENHLSQNILIFAKYFGAKIIVRTDSDCNPYFFKNKNQPITDIDFIVNDMYEKPVNEIKKFQYWFQPDETYHFTYDYRNDILICNNPDNPFSSPKIKNNGILFNGILDEDMRKMFINKHTNKILSEFPNVGVSIFSLIIKSKDKSNLFKVDNKNVKIPSYNIPDFYKKILFDVITELNIDDLSRIHLKKTDDAHVYTRIINRIFKKFINGDIDLSGAPTKIPETLIPNDFSSKMKYIDDDSLGGILKNKKLFYIYSMFITQFRKKKVFLGVNDEDINKKYEEIYKKIRGICKNNVFSTSLPPIDEILN